MQGYTHRVPPPLPLPRPPPSFPPPSHRSKYTSLHITPHTSSCIVTPAHHPSRHTLDTPEPRTTSRHRHLRVRRQALQHNNTCFTCCPSLLPPPPPPLLDALHPRLLQHHTTPTPIPSLPLLLYQPDLYHLLYTFTTSYTEPHSSYTQLQPGSGTAPLTFIKRSGHVCSCISIACIVLASSDSRVSMITDSPPCLPPYTITITVLSYSLLFSTQRETKLTHFLAIHMNYNQYRATDVSTPFRHI